ncbi:cory-CC-star protein [Nesterenkonia aurantiaca]|uniref:cory-CC-star protein n=1 Tax=Nesterenkonia aurantiaca TaxID=1436010 RepID=UPI003EE79A4D
MPHTGRPDHSGEADTVASSAGNDPLSRHPGAAEPAGLWKRFNAGLHEFYVAPYRRVFARAKRDEEDLFMMLVLSEALGLPNPASGMTLELLPEMLDRMHEWHTRQGLERSPMDGLGCC